MKVQVSTAGRMGIVVAEIVLISSLSVWAAGGSHSDIARGQYLVEQVAMCGSCHTPHDEKGEPIKDQTLRGAGLTFKPIVSVPWARKAPNIVGLPGWEESDAIKFLMTGLAYNDLPATAPMPQFRMNKADATAIVHYLRSLDAPSKDSTRK